MLNYTTKIPAHTSIAEISKMLAKAGARSVMHDYAEDGSGTIIALSFSMIFNGRQIGFRLPANWQGIQPIMLQKRKKDSRHVPVSFTEQEHCVNIAWRVVKDWVEAQLAMIEANQAKTQQVFLPYAVVKNGQTLYEHIEENPQFLLGGGND